MKANKSLGLVFFPAFDWAISPTHPEREERLLYTQDQIFEEGIQDIEGIKMYNPMLATEKDIRRVHFCIPDVSSRVTESHLISSGGAIRAALAVMNKEVESAFALVRPPGHHAHRIVYGDRGFCVTNIEAIMLERIRAEFGPLRVAIVDTDCHHGDGTEDIYYNDPETLVISFHQDGRTLFPGTGFINEFGGPSAYGYNVNIPLPPNTADEGFLHVLNSVVMPILDDYKPDLIINSAGQDNHYSDPITNMNFSAQGYAKLNHILKPDIAVLEGGYSIDGALPYINVGIILAMAGLDFSQVKEPDYNPAELRQDKEITEYVKRLSDTVLSNWKRKGALWQKEYGGLDSFEKKKQIYYDTDGILEQQVQHFIRCKECSGYNWIDSSSDSSFKVLAITIPRDGCKACVDKAYGMYRDARSSFTNVYLQDRVHDEYLSK
ncbi:MAG TPA: histone deacetylase [Spirochaetales bacterium]|nr:histone deacetylase [Spirochaetales bacterium]